MRKLIIPIAVLFALMGATALVWTASADSRFFRAHLNGDQEVPPRETPALGQSFFTVFGDSQSIGYLLIVARIENVVAAHIHCAPEGENGPVGVTLFSGEPRDVRFVRVLSTGLITEPDSGNGCGWETVEDVVDAMRSGDTYVNVHTNDGMDPSNTGPGDFPGGEIRGQVQ